MKHTSKNSVDKPNLLAINHLWQAFFVPFYPILADICQVSILSAKKAVPVMLDMIACQLLKQTTPSQTQTFQPLTSFLKDDKLAEFSLQNMHSFNALKQLEPYQNKFFVQLFDEKQRPIITGFLLAKTGLNKGKIETLLAWTTLFAIKILHDFCSAQRTSALNETQLTQWRHYQIFALTTPQTADIFQLIDFNSQFSITYYQQQAKQLVEQPQMQEILQNIQQFIKNNYLNNINKEKSVLKNVLSAQPIINTKHDDIPTIFMPKQIKKMSWLDYLQKYWIATGVLLSCVVFGAMSIIMPDKNANTTAQSSQNNHAKTHHTTQKKYHDVAIVKVASTPNETLTTEKHTDDDKATQAVADDKKLSDKKSNEVTKKSVNKKESEKKPKEKTDRPSEKKVSKDKKVDDVKKSDKKNKDEKVDKRPKDEKDRKKGVEKSAKERKSVEKPNKTEPKKSQTKPQEDTKVMADDEET